MAERSSIVVSLQAETDLRVEELTTLEQLDGVQQDWARLWSGCLEATPFQSPDWLIPWWRHLGKGELWVLAVRRGEHLVGLAPFFTYQSSEAAPKQLLLLGTGITDYLDVLLEPEARSAGPRLIVEHLESNPQRWDICDFQQLRGTSPLLTMQPPDQWASLVMVQEVCPVLNLPASADTLASAVPNHMLQKFRYYQRQAQKQAPLQLEEARPGTFPELFESFLAMHRAHRGDRAQKGGLADDRVQEFHREAARRLCASGTLRLYALRLGTEVKACLYGFSHGRCAFYYLSGYDPQLAAVSPGTLLIGYAIESALREGLAEFDFLRGREGYKYLWGSKGRVNYRRQLSHAMAV